MDRPSCPICGDDSCIAKVSAISESTTGVTSQVMGLLAPPPRRTITGPIEYLALFVGLGLIVGVWTFVFLWPRRLEVYALVSIHIGMFVVAVLVWLWGRSRERDYRERESDKYRRALERWDSAYYCGKDDVVFLAGGSTAVPPTQFAHLLQDLNVDSAVSA